MNFLSLSFQHYCLCIILTTVSSIPMFSADIRVVQEVLSTNHSLENIKKAILEKISSETNFPSKHMTVLVYIAGCNDLLPFIERNLMQLMQIGTNNTINLLVHLNTIEQGRKKITKRLIVYKNKLVQVGDDYAMDSGSPETLIHACTWAFTRFPSTMKVVILWNHGTGGIEPEYQRAVNPSELYSYNNSTNMIELNRSIGFLDYIQNHSLSTSSFMRGICFDDVTRHYLTNRQVGDSLRKVSETCLQGAPFDLVCCDACLMADIQFAFSLKPYKKSPVARYLVASQEVVLATGYSYMKLFTKQTSTPYELAKHIVETFGQTYNSITQDYTHSALDLYQLDPLYEHLNKLALLLIEGMTHESSRSVRNFIQKCSSKEACTHFEEPTYKDIYDLCASMLQRTSLIHLTNHPKPKEWLLELKDTLQKICTFVKKAIIHNVNGKNLSRASGVSIYLPSNHIHPSYAKTDFGRETSWLKMLQLYLS